MWKWDLRASKAVLREGKGWCFDLFLLFSVLPDRGEKPCGAVCPTWPLAQDLPVSPHERRPRPDLHLVLCALMQLTLFSCSHPQVSAVVPRRRVQKGSPEADREAGPGGRVRIQIRWSWSSVSVQVTLNVLLVWMWACVVVRQSCTFTRLVLG